MKDKEQLKKYLGIEWNYAVNFRLSKFELTAKNKPAYEAICRFLVIPVIPPDKIDSLDTNTLTDEWFEKAPCPAHFLTLMGPCGTGKTHLAIGAGICGIEKFGSIVAYYQVPDLLQQLRNGYKDGTFQRIINIAHNFDLLILDDLGMQKDTEWATEQLDSIIDYRDIRDKETIITTNLTGNELAPRLSSRLSGGDIVIMDGCPDYRPILAKRRRDGINKTNR